MDGRKVRFIGSICILIGIVFLAVRPPQSWIGIEIPKNLMVREQGYNYIFSPRGSFPTGDSLENPISSTWTLFEDETPLSLGHSLHADIREKGTGRYSHWGTHLYFSSSDNSDPRKNVHRYFLRREKLSFSQIIRLLGGGLFILLLWLFISSRAPAYFSETVPLFLEKMAYPLPLWMIAYVILLPLQIPSGYRLVPSDFFGIIGICHLLLEWKLQGKIELDVWQGSFLAFLAFSLIGRDVTIFPWSYCFELATLSFLFLISLSLAKRFDSVEKLRQTIRFFNTFFAPICAVLFVSCFFRESPWVEFLHSTGTVRLSGPFQFPNQLGIYFIAAIPLALMDFSSFSKGKRVFFYLGLFLILANVGSRASFFIGLWQIFLAERYVIRDSWKVSNLLFLIIPLLILGLFLFLKGDYLFVRAVGLSSQTKGIFLDETRAVDFLEVLRVFPEWSLTGLGLGCVKMRYLVEVHNLFLSVLVETGIFGVFFFLVFLFGHIKNLMTFLAPRGCGSAINDASFRERPDVNLGIAIFISFSGILMMGMFHNIMRNRLLWFLIGIFAGLDKILRTKRTI